MKKTLGFLHKTSYQANTFQLVEAAGGVLSPGPSGTPQSDIYSSLNLPVLLVADGRLGGISTTLSSLESLKSRGYRVPIVAVINDRDSRYNCEGYFRKYLSQTETTVVDFDPLIEDLSIPLDSWYRYQKSRFTAMLQTLMLQKMAQ